MTTQGKLALFEPPNSRVERATDENPPSQDAVSNIDRTLPSWLGLVTSHRRLFDASQDGWMRPLHRSCFLLGHESFVSEEWLTGRNVVPVRLAFDVSKLPFPDARKDLERESAVNNDEDGSRTVRWRAPIPLYAIKRVEVSSIEHKTRLLTMAGQLANVCMPGPEVGVSDSAISCSAASVPANLEPRLLELPENLNAVQGAMAMAVWAVPRIEPWIEVLQHALAQDAARAKRGIRRLGSKWLQLPWLGQELMGPAREEDEEQEGLWRAALHCMQWSSAEDRSPGVLAEKIARTVIRVGTKRSVDKWLDRTRRIIAAEETINCDGWQRNGAGLAIQLALLRPDPMRFRSWSRDLPGIPPAVWWAAATLCGWRHGYRILDKKFRGDANLQEFLATRALAASWPGGDAAVLPPSQRSLLKRTREEGWFTLTWSGHPVLRKPWQSRAKWYSADLTDPTTDRAARDLAGRWGWPCVESWLSLPEGRVSAVGSGTLSVDGDALVVEGEKLLRLPEGVGVDERCDPDEFRRCLATEAGVLGDPPVASRRQPVSALPCLIYWPDFITEEEELELLACIDGAEWSTELQRRVQHYGWRYDYKKRQIDESMRVGPLPQWAQELGRRLVNEGLMVELPDQVIVNEYCGKQGITPHIDQPNSFAEHVATISLLETWGMVFRRRGSKEKIEKALERRSVAVLTGDARYKWTHEIPKRASELLKDRQGKRRRVKRSRRISLTFRTTQLRRSV